MNLHDYDIYTHVCHTNMCIFSVFICISIYIYIVLALIHIFTFYIVYDWIHTTPNIIFENLLDLWNPPRHVLLGSEHCGLGVTRWVGYVHFQAPPQSTIHKAVNVDQSTWTMEVLRSWGCFWHLQSYNSFRDFSYNIQRSCNIYI